MTVTVASFRQNYTEFQDVARFPASGIQYYLTVAAILLSPAKWQTLLDVGIELFIAHNVSLESKARDEGQNGGQPGGMTGPVSAQSVDKVSITYDSNAGIDLKAGHWNLTIYGVRFYRLANQLGMGPMTIGGMGCPDPLSSAGAFSGPWYSQIPNPSNSG